MEESSLLLEYLKEQYAQARQHETLRTNATTFLTAAAGAVFAIAFKDGVIRHDNWWIGIIILGIGVTNLVIVHAHFRGNRFHTTLAGLTRRELEKTISWSDGVSTPSKIRRPVAAQYGLTGDDSIGSKTHAAIRWIPVGIIVLGIATSVIAWKAPDGSVSGLCSVIREPGRGNQHLVGLHPATRSIFVA